MESCVPCVSCPIFFGLLPTAGFSLLYILVYNLCGFVSEMAFLFLGLFPLSLIRNIEKLSINSESEMFPAGLVATKWGLEGTALLGCSMELPHDPVLLATEC